MTLHDPGPGPSLRRVITLWPLVFYGLGIIVGAGIYVSIGSVVARAGAATPVSFVLAGIVALLTGLCYAELGSRHPEAAGAAAYVRHGFGSDRLAQLVGLATTLAVAIAAASIAGGTVRYLQEVLTLPPVLLLAVLIGGFTAVAASGVRGSVWLAALIGLLEIGGLLLAMGAGLLSAPAYDFGIILPAGAEGWRQTLAGAFIAFFAFIGFETIANMGEEVKQPERNLPRGIMIAVLGSMVIYAGVALVTVWNAGAGDIPILDLFEGRAQAGFALLGAVAISNGVLVEIIMLSRLFYGMARKGQLPAFMGRIHPRTKTPLPATLVAGAIVLLAAIFFSFERLIIVANVLTLLIFASVDLALWNIHRRAPGSAGTLRLPRWVPVAATASTVVLLVAEFLG